MSGPEIGQPYAMIVFRSGKGGTTMTASERVVKSTKDGLHVTIGDKACATCLDWTHWQGDVGACESGRSTHYGHLLLSGHPACENYFDVLRRLERAAEE